MKRLFFDIETIPAGEDKIAALRDIFDRSKAKGKRVNQEFEDFLKFTTFDGAFGRLLCISYALNDDPVQCIFGDEKDILKKFWEVARDVDLFVGFNILEFDLRFIYQRSIVLGVRPSQAVSFARYRSAPIYDLMQEWTNWSFNNKISMHALALALHIKSSKQGELDGSKVYDYYKEGKTKEIYEYCNADVEVTRAIYKKMVFLQ